MSATSPSFPSSPVGSIRPNRAPGIGDAVRSFLSLLWIEIRRSQGHWLLPLMVGLGWYLNRGQDWEDIVLWPNLSKWTMQSYLIVGPLAAALAAWLVDRDRRRRMQGLVETMATSPFRRDLVLLATAAFWGLAGYALIAGWYGLQGVREATWGGPDVQLVGTGALGVVILAGVGFIVGRLVRGKFSPIIAVAAAYFVSAAPEFIQTWINPDSGQMTSMPIRPLAPWGLVPWGLVAEREPSVFEKFPAGYLGAGLLWLAAALAITIVAIALMRSWRRNWTAWIGLAVSGAVATVSADRVMGYDSGAMFEEDLRVPFTWSCTTTSAAEVCVHPAYEAKLDESARRLNEMLGPIVGLPGVPARWEQVTPFAFEQREVGRFYPGSQYVNTHEIGEAIFSSEGGPDLPASQLVIATWLLSRGNPEVQLSGMFSFPSELMQMSTSGPMGEGGVGLITIDQDAEAFYAREIPAAADRFAALSPEAQRAWLEANWSALRAGQLTLDQMP